MDDLTLWMVLRHICRITRSEAEREFATTRLSRLKLDWTCKGTFIHQDHDYKLEYDCRTKHIRTEFLGLDDDEIRARFRVPMHCKVQGVAGDYVADQAKFNRIVDDLVSKALMSVDVAINNEENNTKLTAVLDFFSNNNPLPAMQYDIEAEECLFDWKAFLNVFYADYMFVERLKHPRTPYVSIADRNEVSEQDFERQWNSRVVWPKTYGRLEDPLFEHADLVRLKRAHTKAELRFSLDSKRFEEIKEDVVRVRWKRNKELYDYLRWRHDMRELQEEMMRLACQESDGSR
jgi:hypothetical protein